MNKYILSILLVLPYSGLVIAQENTDVPVVEEIIVTGIKDSLQNAIDIKRSNVGVMDAITAEDFGKFPDGNLAESLARVAGVGIDRSNVEGERVAVRGFGPEFNLVTLNGRQMPTVPGQWGGGRSFNFGDIASPGISAVEIYKSTNGSLPSGGIGSTINMVTTRPLNIEGTKRTISFNFVDDTTSEESDYLRADSPIETSFLYGTKILGVSHFLDLIKIVTTEKKEQEKQIGFLILKLFQQMDTIDYLLLPMSLTTVPGLME